MIPLHVPAIDLKELLAFPREDYVSKLENVFRTSFGKENILFTASARNAIYLALRMMKLERDNEVLVPGYACYAVQAAIQSVCKPVFVDIDEKTSNINPEEVEKHITKNTKAILVAHLYGNPCKLDKIIDIARVHNLPVIEDAAQGLGGRYNGKMLGSFGNYTVFSFWFTKDITSFRGGALLTSERLDINLTPAPVFWLFPRLFASLFALRQIRLAPSFIYSPLRRRVLIPFFTRNSDKFRPSNETLYNYQCYLLYKQFAEMSYIIGKRRWNAKYYSERLGDLVTLPVEMDNGEHTYFRYTAQLDDRDKLCRHLLANGIEADKMYDYYLAPLPQSMGAAKKNLNLPVHHKLSKNDLNRVIEVVRDFKRMG